MTLNLFSALSLLTGPLSSEDIMLRFTKGATCEFSLSSIISNYPSLIELLGICFVDSKSNFNIQDNTAPENELDGVEGHAAEDDHLEGNGQREVEGIVGPVNLTDTT